MTTVLVFAGILAFLALVIGILAWLRDDATPEEQSWFEL